MSVVQQWAWAQEDEGSTTLQRQILEGTKPSGTHRSNEYFHSEEENIKERDKGCKNQRPQRTTGCGEPMDPWGLAHKITVTE